MTGIAMGPRRRGRAIGLLGLLVAAATSLGLLGLAPVAAEAATSDDGSISAEIEFVDPAEDGEYAVGDVLAFTYVVVNLLDEDRSLSLVESNLDGDEGCKWFKAAPGAEQRCVGRATHTVTAADLAAGAFTPTATWGIHSGIDYVGIASEVEVVGEPVDLIGPGIRAEVVATNAQADHDYEVGDVLEFAYVVTNLLDEARSTQLLESNLDGDAGCKWSSHPAGTTYECGTPRHTVTAADLEAGSFVPTATWAIHTGTGYPGAQESIEIVGDPVGLVDHTEAGNGGLDFDASWEGEPFYTSTQLATNGVGGFPNYRIVALAVTNSGDLLASYDGRPTGADSPGPNSILQRRSTDGGQTWEEQTVIHAGKVSRPIHGFSDPSYIVDRITGEVFNFHVYSQDQGFFGSHAGTDPSDRNVAHVEVSRSTDGGRTWTHEIITDQITPDPSWTSRFATSGQGIQLKYGEHAGRLIQQFPVMVAGVIKAVSVYSDDHGDRWQAGTPVGVSMDENKTVELSDGRVMLNSRDSARSGYRKVAFSTDGGVTYGEVTLDRELPDPTNNASIIRAFPNAAEGSDEARILLFSNSASTTSRTNGTIRMSCDDGQTWPISKTFEPGGMAYSTLATQPDGSIGLLYEPGGGGGGIAYANFNLAWLGGICAGVTADEASVDPGSSVDVQLTVTNQTSAALTGAAIALDLPAGWTASEAVVPEIAPGGSVRVPVTIAVPAGEVPQTVRIPLTLTTPRGSSSGSLSVRVNAPVGQPITVVGTHTNPKDLDTYEVGDRLEFTFAVENISGGPIAVVPDGTLEGFDPDDGAPNCRYRALPTDGGYECTTAFHVVTQADLDAGEFAPVTSWDAREGGESGPSIGSIALDSPVVILTSGSTGDSDGSDADADGSDGSDAGSDGSDAGSDGSDGGSDGSDGSDAGADGSGAGSDSGADGSDAGADGSDAGSDGGSDGSDGADVGADGSDAGTDGSDAGSDSGSDGSDGGSDGADVDADGSGAGSDGGSDGSDAGADGSGAGSDGGSDGSDGADVGADGSDAGADGSGAGADSPDGSDAGSGDEGADRLPSTGIAATAAGLLALTLIGLGMALRGRRLNA
ncbi:hypothetical protein GCG21_00215 [Pseudactinotalea sp. HY160]|uniref:exo-alpha-sialidase n=1 Tax=Pseudactinotalea sp. HY160 TaxID=2654490 RepID=UPI00128BCDFA|nr:exo-alpha-sialidase [Pseudactinotalea sp. HY160]MPV48456.1 hypothetical protein [Pseudactinotalea sp. HY160]